MKKIKLTGLGNEKEFNHYTFEKSVRAHEVLSDLFEEVLDIRWPLFDEHYHGEESKVEKVNISKYKDFHKVVGGNRTAVGKSTGSRKKGLNMPRVDIFFGDRKMFITISCPLPLRRKFHDELGKVCEIPNPAKFKEKKLVVKKKNKGKKAKK